MFFKAMLIFISVPELIFYGYLNLIP